MLRVRFPCHCLKVTLEGALKTNPEHEHRIYVPVQMPSVLCPIESCKHLEDHRSRNRNAVESAPSPKLEAGGLRRILRKDTPRFVLKLGYRGLMKTLLGRLY